MENNKILGYIVLRINKFLKAYPTGFVVDLITYPNRVDVAEMLFNDAIEFFNQNNVNVIQVWIIRNHPLHNMFKKSGFNMGSTNVHVLYSMIIGEKENERLKTSSIEKLYFQYGDTDWI